MFGSCILRAKGQEGTNTLARVVALPMSMSLVEKCPGSS